MKEEREGLLKDLAKLKTALQHLAARNQGTMLSNLHMHGYNAYALGICQAVAVGYLLPRLALAVCQVS